MEMGLMQGENMNYQLQKHSRGSAVTALGIFVIVNATAGAVRLDEAANRHADPGAAIDSSNVGQLRQSWRIASDGPITHRPLIRNGRIYFADWNGVVSAADITTGKVLWRKQV